MPVPRVEVEIRYEVDWKSLSEPTAEVEINLPLNREYSPELGREATWELAAESLASEREAVSAIADDVTDQDSFDDAAFEDDTYTNLYGLDLGVQAACIALSAAGCVTASSCRGHGSGWSTFPVIVFVSDRQRAALIEEIAREVGCGLQSDQAERTLELWAPSIIEMHGFAEKVLEHRADFEAISLPRSVAALRHEADDEEPW